MKKTNNIVKHKQKKLGDYFHNRKKSGMAGIPILSVTMNSGLVERNTLDRKMASDLPPESNLLVEPGDIVYNMMRMWQGAVAVCTQRGLVSPAYVVCTPNDKIDPLFALYLFKCQRMMYKLTSYSYGITGDRLRLYFKDFAAIPVDLAPLLEQQKIAEILSAWDRAIGQIHRLIAAKKKHRKGLMQQLLWGRKRLGDFKISTGRHTHRFFDIPYGWQHPQLKTIAKEITERNKDNDGLTVLACSKHRGFIESSQYFGKQVHSENTSNYKVIRRGCFGFPANHIEEGSIGLLLSHNEGLVSPIYIVFKCNEKIVPVYLYAVFKTETFRHIFSISTNSSVDRRGSLRWREFSLIRVPLPPTDEQRAIAEVLQTADQEINQLEAKLQALEKQKRGLMQKLLTGEIRVAT